MTNLNIFNKHKYYENFTTEEVVTTLTKLKASNTKRYKVYIKNKLLDCFEHSVSNKQLLPLDGYSVEILKMIYKLDETSELYNTLINNAVLTVSKNPTQATKIATD